ncbi:hypothetical protein GDO81_012633, partial [Engystomops pustulosus]
ERSLVLKSLKNSSDMNSELFEYFVDNGEWIPLEVKVEEKIINGYSRLLYTMVIQRQSSLYTLALILPSLCLLALDLLCHFIPKSYNEKVGFKITLLLGISVLMLLLNDFLPASSDNPPVIVIFFIGTMTLMCTGILETILVMYIGGRMIKPESTCTGTFPLYQGLLLKSPSKEINLKEEEHSPEDGVLSSLERIRRDVHLMREQILSMQSSDKLETERENFQEKMEKVVFYCHLTLVSAFYIVVFVKWKW